MSQVRNFRLEVLIENGHDDFRSDLSGTNSYYLCLSAKDSNFLQDSRYTSCHFQYVSILNSHSLSDCFPSVSCIILLSCTYMPASASVGEDVYLD